MEHEHLTKTQYQQIDRIYRDGGRQAKAQNELSLATNAKNKKKKFLSICKEQGGE